MSLLYGLYHGVNMDYGTIICSQLVQIISSSSRYSEISCARFWTIITHWVMEKFIVPKMEDSLKSSIATFDTTVILVSDPSKFILIGSILESMYRCVSPESNVINEYKKLTPSGPRQLTPEMQSSPDAADKPVKRWKKPDKKGEKDGQSSKVSTPKKRKSEQASTNAPKKKKHKMKAHRQKSPSPSSTDSEYVPSDPQLEPESTEDDATRTESPPRGNSPPPSPTIDSNGNSPLHCLPHPVPITIAPCPPPISSTTATSILIPTSLCTTITTTTTHPTEPNVHVNVSTKGASTFGSDPPITFAPLSPPPSH